MTMLEDAGTLQATRQVLHRLAVHLLARRRSEVAGRIGLRAAPGGLATPAFGPGPEVVRVAGPVLVHEVGGEHASRPVNGSTLAELAEFVDVDLDAPFDAGTDTPPVGDPHAVLRVDGAAVAALAGWWHLGWQVLDAVLAALPAGTGSATVQLWPEHFDAATTVTLPSDVRVNVGFSPGDGFSPVPYVYVGPWDPARPGDQRYWNAPFGAVRRATDLDDGTALEDCRRFVEQGLAMLAGPGD